MPLRNPNRDTYDYNWIILVTGLMDNQILQWLQQANAVLQERFFSRIAG